MDFGTAWVLRLVGGCLTGEKSLEEESLSENDSSSLSPLCIALILAFRLSSANLRAGSNRRLLIDNDHVDIDVVVVVARTAILAN